MGEVQVIGHDLVVTITNANPALLRTEDCLRELARISADAASSVILQSQLQTFQPEGLTFVAILSSSHVAIHTWPELGLLTLDLFACTPVPLDSAPIWQIAAAQVGGTLAGLSQRPRTIPIATAVRSTSTAQQAHGVANHHSDEAGTVERRDPWCKCCGGARVCADDLAGWLAAVLPDRPTRERSLGQNPVDHLTNARRAAYLSARSDVDGRDVLIIGDDDCTSIAIASLCRPRLLEVVDYDIRVVDYITQVSDRYALSIKTRLLDVAAGVPSDMVRAYDCVLCDPIPSRDGLRMFVGVAKETLRFGGVLYLSAIPTDAPNLQEFHDVTTTTGFMATDMIDDFSRYSGDLRTEPQWPHRYRRVVDRIEFTETWVRMVHRQGMLGTDESAQPDGE